jgi:ribonuclease E
MTKRMLIDATHAEETRVVVLDGNRLEDFDVETATKRHLKGNIYLAKVVRVEPSLQAAFVEYGGNRHGFLAFSEIHPDYYQIPVADRQRLIEMAAEEARLEEEEEDLELALQSAPGATQPAEAEQDTPFWDNEPVAEAAPAPNAEHPGELTPAWALAGLPSMLAPPEPAGAWAQAGLPAMVAAPEPAAPSTVADAPTAAASPATWALAATPALLARPEDAAPARMAEPEAQYETQSDHDGSDGDDSGVDDSGRDDSDSDDGTSDQPPPDSIGGDQDSPDEQRERRMPPRFMRNYKIQEVIRRRQILLIQVVKEERGTKGAALTTYLSLAGRFGVLMPNSPRGGGISRKITSAADRRRLKEITTELDLPRGMGLIIRTAGAARPKPEIKRDCEYLLRLWDDIREHTMKSVAPALIYEEASLIKRVIRDVYSRDIDEIVVDGEDGWRAAHDFMRMLMPSHAKKVQLWRDGAGGVAQQPLFARHQVEAQLDAMLMPTVQLRSGGYLVINQAEALVAIDVNSGRSTRERNIEETALRTNLEAADEVARQLRLRDLAGLIVIDFIDMESKRHNAMVERRLKDALKDDRARIQIGHISHFGLLEMSRQRLRPSLAETSFVACPHCAGTGLVRGTESSAVHILRGIEDEGSKRRAAEIIVHVATPAALYLLNHKRDRLRDIELRYAMRVIIAADDSQLASQFRIERVRAQTLSDLPPAITQEMAPPTSFSRSSFTETEDVEPDYVEDEDIVEDVSDFVEEPAQREPATTEPAGEQTEAARTATGEAEEAERRRKRRRRRRGRREDTPGGSAEDENGDPNGDAGDSPADAVASSGEPADSEATADESGGVLEAPTAEQIVAELTTTDGVAAETAAGEPGATEETEEEARNRRRGRRGGRRRRREPDGELSPLGLPGAEQPDLLPVYTGPTPANPFGNQAFDIFDVIDQVERAAESGRPIPTSTLVPEPVAHPVADSLVELEAPSSVTGLGPEAESVPEVVASSHPTPESLVELEAPSAIPESVSSGDVTDGGVTEAPEPVTVIQEPSIAADPVAVVPVTEAAIEPVAASAAPVAEAPALMAEPVAEAPVEAPPEPTPVAANDIAPVIKPIVIGSEDAPPVEKKRGWWRRG